MVIRKLIEILIQIFYTDKESHKRRLLTEKKTLTTNLCDIGKKDHSGSGYPLEPWLMTPYKNAVDPIGKYNDIHPQARSIVNRCIDLYKGRWRIFMEDRKSRHNGKIRNRLRGAPQHLHTP
ncbi:uncharacterized protein ACN427_013091 [Glossina fuscipes fuscipes]